MNRLLTQFLVLSVGVGVCFVLLTAQEAPAPPTTPPVLSELNKLKIQTLSQAMEIDQLHAQQAQASFDQHKADLQKLVTLLTIPGYDLNAQLEYVPQSKPVAPTKP